MESIPHFPAAVELPDAFGRAPALVIGLVLAFLIAYLVAWLDHRRRSLVPVVSPPARPHDDHHGMKLINTPRRLGGRATVTLSSSG